MVIYDRSWYSRALLQPVMGWCSQRQYKNFMRDVMDWEHDQQVEMVKIWLSVDDPNSVNCWHAVKMTHCVIGNTARMIPNR